MESLLAGFTSLIKWNGGKASIRGKTVVRHALWKNAPEDGSVWAVEIITTGETISVHSVAYIARADGTIVNPGQLRISFDNSPPEVTIDGWKAKFGLEWTGPPLRQGEENQLLVAGISPNSMELLLFRKASLEVPVEESAPPTAAASIIAAQDGEQVFTVTFAKGDKYSVISFIGQTAAFPSNRAWNMEEPQPGQVWEVTIYREGTGVLYLKPVKKLS